MAGVGVEEQAVAGLHGEKAIAMAIDHLAFQHVEKLHAFMLKRRKRIGIGAECNQIGLDDDPGRVVVDMTEQVVLMTGPRPAPLELHPPSPAFTKTALRGSS